MSPVAQKNPIIHELKTPQDFRLPALRNEIIRDGSGDPIVRSLIATTGPYGKYLFNNREHHLDRDIALHLGSDRNSRYALVRELAEALPPLDPHCRLSICIPVAAHEEENYIRRTVEGFRNQTAPRESWEIVFYLNHPDTDSANNPIVPDETMDELERARAENPELRIRSFYLPVPRAIATIGLVRRLLHDVVALRSLMRDREDHEHYMLRTDADILSLSPHLVERYIEQLDAHPKLSGVAGPIRHSLSARQADPVLHFGARITEILIDYEQSANLRAYSAGANIAFRLSSYIQAGGFEVDKEMGEDIAFDAALQENILFLRVIMPNLPENPPFGVHRLGDEAEIVVSARRTQKALEGGQAAIEQWARGDSLFGTENLTIRRWTEPTITPGAKILDNSELPNRLNNELNRTLSYFNWDGSHANFYKLAAVIEEELGLVLGPDTSSSVDFDRLNDPNSPMISIKNMKDLLRQMRKELFDPSDMGRHHD